MSDAGLRAGVMPKHEPPMAPEDTEWDRGASETELRAWASSDGSGDASTVDWEKYRWGFAWYDDANDRAFNGYRLPHHQVVDNELEVVWAGVATAMGVLLEGTGGAADIPEADIDAVKAHLAAHYAQFGKPLPGEDEPEEEDETMTDEEVDAAAGTEPVVDPPAAAEPNPETARAVAELKAAAANGFVAMRAVGRAVAPVVAGEPAGGVTAAVEDADPNVVSRRFRLMSASHFRPTMGWFAVTVKIPEDVLRASLPKFGPSVDANGTARPLTVYKDHHTSVSEWCGTIDGAPEFVEAADAIPAGVENVINLDRIADPKIARGVETGALRSVSAGFTMKWEQSHPDMEEEDFFLASVEGTEVDGEKVALVCTMIDDVDEMSVVWEGADPHAKQIGAAATASGEAVETVDAEASDTSEEQEDEGMWREYLIAALGLTEDADEAAIKAAQELVIAESKSDEVSDSLARLTAAIGSESEDMDAIVAEVIALRKDTVPKAEHDALVADMTKRDCSDVVETAIREGRIAPSERDDMLAFATSDIAATRVYLAKRQPSSAVPLGEQAGETDGTAGAGTGLTPAQAEHAESLGIKDLEAYAEEIRVYKPVIR